MSCALFFVAVAFHHVRVAADDQVLIQQTVDKVAAAGPFDFLIPKIRHKAELAFMHVPYNFGHTVESVGMLPTLARNLVGTVKKKNIHRHQSVDMANEKSLSWGAIRAIQKPNSAIWGHANPDIQMINAETGCRMYFSPPKYWPEALAHQYFGNKTVVGILRDPYERLVSMFRGNLKGYGQFDQEFFERCDVNGAVKKMLKGFLEGKSKFASDCTFLPQAEYYEGPFGITVAVDNRRFPHSMNEVFDEFGYSNMHIRQVDIFHVADCPNAWAGDFDQETRSLVQEVYKRDFELLCKTFGYCDKDENVCLEYIEDMCPPKHFVWNATEEKWNKNM